MTDPFKVAGSIVTVAIICLVAVPAARAQDAKNREIIETDFMPAAGTFATDGQAAPVADPTLPAPEASFQPVPVELIGDLAPLDPQRQFDGSGGGVASAEGGAAASSGSGDGSSGDGGSGSGGSSGGSSGGDSGSGDSGGGDSGSGDSGGGGKGGGKGHGKGGSKK